jgi:DNA-binding transcriptional ArsR family regulator
LAGLIATTSGTAKGLKSEALKRRAFATGCRFISKNIELFLTQLCRRVISTLFEETSHATLAQSASIRRRRDHRASARSLLRCRDPLGELPLMKAGSAIEALGALAQEHRLALFRLLVQAGDKGMAAGAIADALGVPNSSLSFHLTQLRNAGLILQERKHRSLIYRANYPAMNTLVAYLMENCCGGADCAPDAACAPSPQERKSA